MAKKPKLKPLPDVVYVMWQVDETDPRERQWLSAGETPDEFAEKNETVRLGVYKLVEFAEVKNSNAITIDRPEV